MTDRIVFTGETDDGTQLLVEWYPNDDAEVLYVSTRRSPFALVTADRMREGELRVTAENHARIRLELDLAIAEAGAMVERIDALLLALSADRLADERAGEAD